MTKTLTVVGGTYFEECLDPPSYVLSGSGLRGACALSGKGFQINYLSLLAKEDIGLAKTICASFGIEGKFQEIGETIRFLYAHPLSLPFAYGINQPIIVKDIHAENILYYGLKETNIKIKSSYAVYDPQNQISFRDTASETNHLALIMNKFEAIRLSGLPEDCPLDLVGKQIMRSQDAEVVVIKNGARGAMIFEGEDICEVPVFKTSSVWPIGSGDIFTATFALKWMMDKWSAKEASLFASKSTAGYCESRLLPIPDQPEERQSLSIQTISKKIYLAGPFFDMGQKWLINETRNILLDFGNNVFSPLHDAGTGDPKLIAPKNIDAIKKADLVIAILNGTDPGTLFEIGYARANKIRTVVFHENVSQEDLFMLLGTGCECFTDFSSAIYSASW